MFYVNRFFGVGKWRKWCGNAWFCGLKLGFLWWVLPIYMLVFGGLEFGLKVSELGSEGFICFFGDCGLESGCC